MGNRDRTRILITRAGLVRDFLEPDGESFGAL
jgi:hypothetical protein